jgi:hypothetical protein
MYLDDVFFVRANVVCDKQAEKKREIQHKERKSRKQQRTQPIIATTLVPTTGLTCRK